MTRARPRLFRVGDMPIGRIEAFSDAIVAIVLTLLMLEFHVSKLEGTSISPALARSLVSMAPKFLASALSFAIVCIWWVAHYHLFHVLTRSDRGLLWINSSVSFLALLHSVPYRLVDD